MYTNSIADHMRVVKHLAPAGYLQAHAFNLGGALSPACWWDLDLAASPRVVRNLDLSEANPAFAVWHLAVTEPEFMRISLGDI